LSSGNLKVRFLAAGGCLFENTPFEGQWFTGWRDSGSRAEFQNAVLRCDGAFFSAGKQARQGKSQMAFAW